MVRPEHASLVSPTRTGTNALKATLEHIVYFGTDTHYHVKLKHGSEFIVREPERPRRYPLKWVSIWHEIALESCSMKMPRRC